MNSWLPLLQLTIKELLHEKVFYILFGFCLISMIFSLLLGNLTYAEQNKLTLNFMLGATEITMVVFCILISITLVKRDLNSKILSIFLSKPIERYEWLMVRYFGQACIQTALVILMMCLVYFTSDLQNKIPIIQSGLLLIEEISILTAFSYLLSLNCSSVLTAMGSVLFFLVCHFHKAIGVLFKSPNGEAPIIYQILFPDFEVFNLKNLAVYEFQIPWVEVGFTSLYALLLVGIYLCMAFITFEDKDIYT